MSSDHKIKRLKRELTKLRRVLIAYSGGTDSAFLCAVAAATLGNDNVYAVTAASATYPTAEQHRAVALARRLGIRHTVIVTNELKHSAFAANAADRCFHCKNELFGKLAVMAKNEGMVLCDGNNYSDRSDYRPGRRAAKKWDVASPLEAARMTKDDIRALSRKMKLPTWNLPAQACLASRIPYGTPITRHELRKVERAEILLRDAGFTTFRLRHHGAVARIEVSVGELCLLFKPGIRERIIRGLRRLGWRYITADLEGYRCGSLNP